MRMMMRSIPPESHKGMSLFYEHNTTSSDTQPRQLLSPNNPLRSSALMPGTYNRHLGEARSPLGESHMLLASRRAVYEWTSHCSDRALMRNKILRNCLMNRASDGS